MNKYPRSHCTLTYSSQYHKVFHKFPENNLPNHVASDSTILGLSKYVLLGIVPELNVVLVCYKSIPVFSNQMHG